jgi:ubiquinone/menaquinone biosynthesis C-methylase UbiE
VRTDRDTVRTDFDRIAQHSTDRWDHNVQYHRYLLEHVPSPCSNTLDLGCGTGAFSCLLAQRCGHVLGLDLSPEMVRVARQRSGGYQNVEFQVGDARDWDFGEASFDCIASIATLHHLPLEDTLLTMKRALKPGGVLLVLDLCRGEGLKEKALGAAMLPPSVVLKMLHNRRLRAPAEARAAWDTHGAHDTYPTVAEVRRLCARTLPGARVRQHLFWRYSVVWTKGEPERTG